MKNSAHVMATGPERGRETERDRQRHRDARCGPARGSPFQGSEGNGGAGGSGAGSERVRRAEDAQAVLGRAES